MLRNKEVRQFCLWMLLIMAVLVLLALAVHPAAVGMVLVSAAVFNTAFFIFTAKRYQQIASLSEQIDQVLHNADVLWIHQAEEGELAILQSEIAKMTLRIQEQNRQLKKEREQLAQSLADIAHQLRTPLTSANLIISLLETESNERKRKELLREEEALFLQMDWLLSTLLKLSRLDAGMVEFQREQIAVEQLLAHAVRPLAIALELREITLQKSVPKGMVLQGDASWLSEALQNILKNCMQSIGSSGRIEILGSDTFLYSELVIHDSGAGFCEEELGHVFERFYRGSQEHASGYGIGLALCQRIIVQQGGTITAKNHPQGGAMFILRFPK